MKSLNFMTAGSVIALTFIMSGCQTAGTETTGGIPDKPVDENQVSGNGYFLKLATPNPWYWWDANGKKLRPAERNADGTFTVPDDLRDVPGLHYNPDAVLAGTSTATQVIVTLDKDGNPTAVEPNGKFSDGTAMLTASGLEPRLADGKPSEVYSSTNARLDLLYGDTLKDDFVAGLLTVNAADHSQWHFGVGYWANKTKESTLNAKHTAKYEGTSELIAVTSDSSGKIGDLYDGNGGNNKDLSGTATLNADFDKGTVNGALSAVDEFNDTYTVTLKDGTISGADFSGKTSLSTTKVDAPVITNNTGDYVGSFAGEAGTIAGGVVTGGGDFTDRDLGARKLYYIGAFRADQK
jgi:C-lobe and N-lobe beta barrels of Tf-binding protein B